MNTRKSSKEFTPLQSLLQSSFKFFFTFALLLLISQNALSALTTTPGISYTGKIMKADGITPVISSGVTFSVAIYDINHQCLLFTETRTLDMSASGGTFSFDIGDGSGAASYRGNVTDLFDLFNNAKAFTGLTCTAGTGFTAAAVNEPRVLMVSFDTGDGNGAQTLPALKINPNPSALQAYKLNGYGTGDFLKVDTAVSRATNANTDLSQTQYDEFWRLVKNPSTAYLAAVPAMGGDVTGTVAANTVTKIRGVNVVATAPTTNQVLTFDGTNWGPAAATGGAGSGVNSIIANLPLSVTGTATSTLSIAKADTSTDGYLSATDWNAFTGKLSSALASAKIWVGNSGGAATAVTMSGDASLDNAGAITVVKTTTAENSKILSLNGTGVANVKGVSLQTGTGSVALQSAGTTANYSLTFPAAAPGATQMLQSDASGVLTWVATPGGGGSSQWTTTGSDIYYNTGNVGVGTNSPTHKLEVSSSSGNYPLLVTNTSTSNSDKVIALFKGALSNPAALDQNISLGILQSTNTANNYGLMTFYNASGADATYFGTQYLNHAGYGSASADFFIGTSNSSAPTERMRVTSTGNVGIGKTNPDQKLQVNGNIRLGNSATGFDDNGDYTITTGGQLTISANDGTSSDGAYYGLNLEAGKAGTMGVMGFSTAGVTRMTIDQGYVIVAGQMQIAGGNPGAGKVLTSDATGIATWQTPGAGSSQWTTTGSDIYYNTGKVGIGTATPASMLDVAGDATINGVTVGRGASNNNRNTVLGNNALAVNTSGLEIVAIGKNALANNTSGGDSVAVGYYALGANTNGDSNTAVGKSSFGGNSSGSNGVAVGYQALASNSTGNYNVAVGYNALMYNTTSSENTAVGTNALTTATGGYNTAFGYAAGSTITTGGGNVLIGDQVQTSTATSSNQLNIGNWIYGNNGNISIGNWPSGTAKFEVNGQVKITGGVPGVGKVLTSDAAGLATWEAAGAGSSQWTTTGNDISYTTGNVGIGTASPNTASKLVVANGTNQQGLEIQPGSGAIRFLAYDRNGNALLPMTFDSSINTFSGKVGIGAAPTRLFDVMPNSAANQSILRVGAAGYNDGFTINQDASQNLVYSFAGGNVGIGTSSPSTNLEVAGQVKITGGSPGSGKVLTSDAAGLATWQTPSGGGGGSDAGYTAANKGIISFDVDAATSGINVTTGVASVNAGTGANQIAKFGTNKQLQTAGQVASAVYNNGSSTSFDFNNGNMQYTSADCQAMTLTNMIDGGTYTIAVMGTNPAICSFTHGGLTFRASPIISTSSGMTIFTFVRMGSTVFTTWVSGF